MFFLDGCFYCKFNVTESGFLWYLEMAHGCVRVSDDFLTAEEF